MWLIILGYFKPIMVYFGVQWPIISSYLAVQVAGCRIKVHRRACNKRGFKTQGSLEIAKFTDPLVTRTFHTGSCRITARSPLDGLDMNLASFIATEAPKIPDRPATCAWIAHEVKLPASSCHKERFPLRKVRRATVYVGDTGANFRLDTGVLVASILPIRSV